MNLGGARGLDRYVEEELVARVSRREVGGGR